MLPETFRSIRRDQKWVSNKLIPSLDIRENQYPILRRYCRIHQFKRFWEQNWVESVFATKAKWGRHPFSLAWWSQMILMHQKLFKKHELIVQWLYMIGIPKKTPGGSFQSIHAPLRYSGPIPDLSSEIVKARVDLTRKKIQKIFRHILVSLRHSQSRRSIDIWRTVTNDLSRAAT